MDYNPFSSYQAISNSNSNEYTYIHGFGFTPPPSIPTQTQMIRSYSSGIGLAVIAYFALSYFMPILLTAFSTLIAPTLEILGIYRPATEIERYLLQDISFVVALFVPFWFYVYAIKMPARAALPMRHPSASLIFGGIPIVLACAVIGSFAASLLEATLSFAGIMPVMPSLALPDLLPAQILYAVRICLLAPIFEELVFRGFLMQSLRRFGDSFALICSAILFAMVHANLVQIPNAFITGLAFGYFAMHTGSIFPAILAHMINNTIALAVSISTQSSGAEERMFITNGISVLYLMAGIAAFLILLRTRPNMFSLSHAEEGEETLSARYRAMFLSLPMVVAGILVLTFTIQYMVAL